MSQKVGYTYVHYIVKQKAQIWHQYVQFAYLHGISAATNRYVSLPKPGRLKDKLHASVTDQHKIARLLPKEFLLTEKEQFLLQIDYRPT